MSSFFYKNKNLIARVVILGTFILVPVTSGAVIGDIAIFSESGGGDAVTTTVASPTWDTTVTVAAGYTLRTVGNPTTVRFADVGKYLAIYNIGFEDSGGSGTHREIQTRFSLEGVTVPAGHATCHFSNTGGVNSCMSSGAAIIDITASKDDLTIENFRTDSSADATVQTANASGFQIIRLNEAWSFARLNEVGGGQAFTTTTWTDVDFDTATELDTVSFGHSGADITLKEVGHYLVMTNNMFTGSGGIRSAETRLTVDGSEVPGSHTAAYMTDTDSSNNHATNYIGIIETTSTNQVLNVESRCASLTCTGISNVGGQTAINLVKLSETGQFIRLFESGGGQSVDGSVDPILFDSESEEDVLSFSHDTVTNSSRINIDHATGTNNYLFLGGFSASRPSSTSVGLYPHWSWRKTGGAGLSYGSFGSFDEGNEVLVSGNSGGLIAISLANTDYIELTNTDDSTGTDATAVFTPVSYAVQGVNLNKLFQVSEMNQLHYRWRPAAQTTGLNDNTEWLAAEDNNPVAAVEQYDIHRLRFYVANTGIGAQTAGSEYKLQYGAKVTTCDAIATWTDLGDAGQPFEDSTAVYGNGDPTTAVLANAEAYTFIAGEGVKKNGDTTGTIGPLPLNNYTEVEYSIASTIDAVFGTSYCFRLFDDAAAAPLDAYTVYPELIVNSSVLTVDILDATDVSVPSPSVIFSALNFSWASQVSTGTLGTASEKIRVNNDTGNSKWTLSLAPTIPTTLWNDGGSKNYDFNDPTALVADGGDTDTVGGQLTVDPSVMTITPEGGCSTTAFTIGSAAAFSEGVTDSVNLITTANPADTGCYWDITGIGASQTVPLEQSAGSYTINMVLTIMSI